MKLVLNIVKWIVVITGVLLIALFSLSFLLRNRVADILLASVNKNLSTRIVIGEYRLSLIKKFPRAAIELSNLTILSSPSFDRGQFADINTDTLLKARSAFLEFGMTDMLNGNYNIQSITISGGKLNLLSDSSGGVNYNISMGSDSSGNNEMVINLDRIFVTDLETRYVNRATSLDISGSIQNGRFRSRIAGNELDFLCNSSFIIRNFELYSAGVKTRATVNIEMNLHQSDSGIVFRKGKISLEDFRFGITGSISPANKMDLKITGQNIRLERIKKYLPEKYAGEFSEYSPEGLLRLECLITGQASRKENPAVNLLFSLEKGKILYRKSNISIRDLSFSGSFSNGWLKRPESCKLAISDYKFQIGSAKWSGNFTLSDFIHPQINTTFSGDLIPSEILEFIPITSIRNAYGSARLNMSLSGKMKKSGKFDLADILSLNPEADIRFNSFSISDSVGKFSFDDIDGNIMLAKNLWADDLYFSYLGQRFRVSGEFTNVPAWLAGKPVRIKAVADVSTDNLNTSLFSSDSTSSEKSAGSAVNLPLGVEADISFRVNDLTWKSFTADKITGRVLYRPGRIDFSSLRISALNGDAEGSCFLVQNSPKTFVAQGSFTFENIDINRTFRSFNNFGQDFIVAENLSGSLSGNLLLRMPLDSMLKPDAAALTAEGKYVITNGALINFEPAKELSDFIEVSELQNITFSRLENDLFIKNSYVAVPQMDIKSSAADFTVSGKHFFDDTYEYHVKTYLSVLLSTKVRKGSRYSNEFGAVEDDGLGRTSVFLKVTGNDEDIKVAYDLKAAGNNVKQNLKKEKGNLKTILNEEYGWFKRDSTVKQDNAPRPKFRISFPETDTSGIVKDTIPSGKNNGNNRIFKKKFDLQPNW